MTARPSRFSAPRAPLSLLAALLLCGAVVLAPSCASDPTKGYAFSSAHDSAIKTVHVPIFQNNTFYHGLETELTDAIIKQLQSATPWSVSTASAAQTTLTGSITEVTLTPLSTARVSGLVQELAVVLTVEFDFKDNRTGKILVSRRNFTASEPFVPAKGAGERIDAGEHAAVQRLARDIVAALRSNW